MPGVPHAYWLFNVYFKDFKWMKEVKAKPQENNLKDLLWTSPYLKLDKHETLRAWHKQLI